MKKQVTKSKLQNLLKEKVLDFKYLDPGYPNSNWVWHIKTQRGKYILKIIGYFKKYKKGCFWKGLNYLFGWNPIKELTYQESLSTLLNKLGKMRLPKILKYDVSNSLFGAPYMLVEKINGKTVSEEDFNLNDNLNYQFGYYIGRIHTKKYSCFGNVSQSQKYKINEFPQRFADTLIELANHNWGKDTIIMKLMSQYINRAKDIIAPKQFAPIMLDIGAPQFLINNNQIAALIDFDSYVIGPIDLEISAIELGLKKGGLFKKGYIDANGSFPAISNNRNIYRFFLYLLYKAPWKLEDCLNAPLLFN